MSNQLIEISQLLNTPDGTYINGAVEGWIAQYTAPFKQGAPAKAKLQEGSYSIDLSLWGGDSSHWNGKRVRFSGKGMKVTEFKGTKQLSVGDKVTIEAAPSDAIPGDSAPHAPVYAAPTRPAPQTPPTGQGNAQQRLMEYSLLYSECIKNARHTVADASFDDTPESVRTIASCFFIQGLREGLKA